MCNKKNKTKKITLALIGQSKSAKTTTIGMLTNNPKMIIDMSAGDRGRTKMSIIWHIIPDENAVCKIENFEYFNYNLYGSINGDVEKYNNNINEDAFLTDIFGLNIIKDKNADVVEYVAKSLNNFMQEEATNLEKIKKIITTAGIEKYVKKINIQVGASKEFSKFLKEKMFVCWDEETKKYEKIKMDLRIVDTRGLLDIVSDKIKTEDKFASSMYDLGLDRLDGILYFCNDEVLSLTDMYADILEKILKSVPIFLVFPKERNMLKNYNIVKDEVTEENIKEYIYELQNGKNEQYDNIELDYFEPTLEFLSSSNIGVTYKKVENNNFEFVNEFVDKKHIEYLLPYSRPIRDIININQDIDFENDIDAKFLRYMSFVTLELIINQIENLHNTMTKLFMDKVISNILQDRLVEQKFVSSIESDYMKYDEILTKLKPVFTKPLLKYANKESINKKIMDYSVKNIGDYGGITTLNNGKLIYYHTVIIAATVIQWLYGYIIVEIDYDNDIKKYESSFNDFGFDDKNKIVKLVKNLLYTLSFRIILDKKAIINNLCIADRYAVDWAIKMVADIKEGKEHPFTAAVVYTLAAFWVKVDEDVKDIPDFYSKNFENIDMQISDKIREPLISLL